MSSYSTHDVAQLLDVPVARVRSFVRSGVLTPVRGSRGEYRFSFQDIVLLRTVAELTATVPAHKVVTALKRLRSQLPAQSPLTSVLITADGDDIVARGDDAVWKPESGQFQFDFQSASVAGADGELPETPVTTLSEETEEVHEDQEWRGGAGDAFAVGVELESVDVRAAEHAYRAALEQCPDDVEAMVNLGRLLHEQGNVGEAEEHYRRALAVQPGHAVAAFNLGVALEDLGCPTDAIAVYLSAVAADPTHADAHYNLSRLYDRAGDRAAALRHLMQYRWLGASTR